MSIADKFNLVVAGTGKDGKPTFLEPGAPHTTEIPGTIDLAWLWSVPGSHHLPHGIGAAPKGMALPGPGGSALGVVRHPARSAGKLKIPDILENSAEAGIGGSDAMHAHDTVDYEIIISGKIDIVLPGNQRRTLKPGDILIMGGLAHEWENIYDEDCVYIFCTIGAERKKK
jgi:mannose-6-phosphate isomerase-like protein (cupin superfamily)